MNMFHKSFDFSWIRCNRCFISISHFNNVALTSCGHFLCSNCSRGVPGYQFNCPICNALVTKITINSERDMPNDILQYFEPLSSVIKKVTDGAQQLIEVSAWRYTQLEDYTKYLEAELAAEREKNRRIEASVNEQQILRRQINLVSNENSKLRANLSSNVSALQFSAKPASSLINEFMHDKSPTELDKSKSIISKESMQQLFIQRPNTSRIIPPTPLPLGPKRPPPTPELFVGAKKRKTDNSTTSFSVPSTPPKASTLTPSSARNTDVFGKYIHRSAEKENQINFMTPQKPGNEMPTNKSTAERFAELRSQNEEASKINNADAADRFAKLRNILSAKSPINMNASQAKE